MSKFKISNKPQTLPYFKPIECDGEIVAHVRVGNEDMYVDEDGCQRADYRLADRIVAALNKEDES